MAKGCDSSWDFDYKSRVDALVDGGYTFIGRYLNHSAGVRNGLTVSEANRLSNAGVFICALYESDSGTSISHFTRFSRSFYRYFVNPARNTSLIDSVKFFPSSSAFLRNALSMSRSKK